MRELEMPALATYKKLDKKRLTFNCFLFQAIIIDEMRQGRLAYLVREEGVKMAAKKARSSLHSRVSNAQYINPARTLREPLRHKNERLGASIKGC